MILAAFKAALWIAAIAGALYLHYWLIKEGENVKKQQYDAQNPKYDAIEDDYI